MNPQVFYFSHLNQAPINLGDLLGLANRTNQPISLLHPNLVDSMGKSNPESASRHIQDIQIHMIFPSLLILYIGNCKPSWPVWIFKNNKPITISCTFLLSAKYLQVSCLLSDPASLHTQTLNSYIKYLITFILVNSL